MSGVNGKFSSISAFWAGKKVFLTGHTGFKGSWLSLWLWHLGARVTGYSLSPNTSPNLFELAGVENHIEKSYLADIRDYDLLKEAVLRAEPEILIHMAAQPLVRYSYLNPVETYSTNLMGTVHFLEAIKACYSAKSVVVITSDKCYENKEWIWGYRENEPMGGNDPYSSSKGCVELIVNAYRDSFFPVNQYDNHHIAIATARAGNVIGGGDWSKDRLIVDAINAFQKNQQLLIRNPYATRPWQHVLEPLSGYLILAQALYECGVKYSGGWNFGPRNEDVRKVSEVIDLLVRYWGEDARWGIDLAAQPHEATLLNLDCSKANNNLGWSPKWNLDKTIESIVQWHSLFRKGVSVNDISMSQIVEYQNLLN